MVDIRRMRRILEKESGDAFLHRTFTDMEREQALGRHDPAEYYAARFAAKEAVFKAVAHLTPARSFDFRIVETLRHEDGSPYIHVTDALRPLLEKAGISVLHISITTEGDFAVAFVIACDETQPVPA